ncbi:MAG: metal ABC transporter permease [Acidimicrobiales bacterium]
MIDAFREAYMQRALLEVVLLGALAGIVSVYVLLRRLAFVSDAITHTIFPGVAIAFVAGWSLFLGALVFALLSALLLTFATRVPKVDHDAALGVLVGAFFSLGVVIVSTRRTYTADLTALLFGRILTVDRSEILETSAVAVVALVALALMHKELVLRAFDPIGAQSAGYRVALLDLSLNAIVALVVVAGVRAVGTVLVIALIVVPGATARLLVGRVTPMLAVSAAVSVFCGFVGLVVSYEASARHGARLGSGATIVITLTIVFAVVAVATAWHRRRPLRPARAAQAGVG